MASPAVRVASRLQRDLQRRGFYVSRHASSMLVMKNRRVVATVHVYGDDCVLSVYEPWMKENLELIPIIKRVVGKHCRRIDERRVPPRKPF
ncbi:hypothetical protein [Pyrofollis japonicus]|uniref:hypothetical protein n=1 Tax=Pyrofollis japonicus TaxID=3060460 RepID=UPI00295A9BAB|nr:hypothetical protein [Pyrofollis japonicus]